MGYASQSAFSPTVNRRGWRDQPWVHLALDIAASAAIVAVLWLTVPTLTLSLTITQIGLGLLAIIGVGLRRGRPRIGFALAASATVVAATLGLTADPLLLAGAALYSVAAVHGRRALPPWLIGGVVAMFAAAMFVNASGAEERMRYVLFGGIVLLGAWALGVNTRAARQLAARNAANEERMRLARDVHDVLSHSLGAIGVQAGVAAHLDGLSAEQLRATLREVELLARSSIAELRALLSATRNDADEATLASSLSDLLAETASSAEKSGVRTTVSTAGIEALPISHRVTIHRVVREAVSNVIKHADARRCDIDITATTMSVTVLVTDDGRGRQSAAGGGFGLPGMKERVSLLGGTLRTGNHERGGFEVCAVLPLERYAEGER